MKSVILKWKEQIAKGQADSIMKEAMKGVYANQELCNSFVTILDGASNDIEGSLSHIPYALKDNVSTKGILTTASSNTLQNYVPVYDATVYERLQKSGAVCIGKTVMDEFGLGATGTTGHTGVVKNPWDVTRQAGGSSAGSAAVVASGAVAFAIGTDTGDSIRKPAAYCGIVGYKPTYGMISRYGILPFASSLDHVGVLTRTVMDAALVVDAIKGKDDKDMTSLDSSNIHLTDAVANPSTTKKKLCYIKEIVDLENYENPSDELKETIRLFHETIKLMKDANIFVEAVSVNKDLLRAIPATYECISCAEATSNLSNLTGISFGTRREGSNVFSMMKEHRTKGFSPLIKRRMIIGSYVLQKENQEKYFLNAQRLRNAIVMKMKELFSNYDALILPCSEGGAKSLENIVTSRDLKVLENHMVIGNFGGFPSITIPNGFVKELPVAINLTSNIFDDENLLEIASRIEQILPYSGQIAGGRTE